MATRTCPDCGAQYVATVRRCIDCDVVLVDEARDADATGTGTSVAAPVGTGDQVGYELEGWGNQLKVTLEGMLANAGIGRVWEAGALVVSAADESIVDDLIATLEGDDLPDLDDDVPRVALEIEGLDPDGQAELDARLIAGAVPHAWDDEAALIVAEADEEQVLEIIGEVLDAQDGRDGDGDGLAAQDALSNLYVAVDRLQKKPTDDKLAASYVAAADELQGLGVPYGFSGADWEALQAESAQLAGLVRDGDLGDDPVDEEAAEGASVPTDPDGDEGPAGDRGSESADDPVGTDETDEEGDLPSEPVVADAADDGVRDAAKALRDRLVDLV